MESTILCYHKVGPAAEEGRRLNIEPNRLRSHVGFFSRRKYRFLRACDLSVPWTPRTVCFTFDDAYVSTMFHAPAVFEEVGARATYYAVSGRVGKTSDWDGEAARPLADWDTLLAVQSRGHEIGNHTVNHVHLADLPIDRQKFEIGQADADLRSRGIVPRSFCYPYGSHNEDSVEILGHSGYGVAVALKKRLASSDDSRLSLPRIVVAYSDTLPMLLYKLFLKARIRSRKPGPPYG